tara:strand:+ start:487 stop:732 length:246 start_codon:yes stop_codon:yes gene_type:complete
MAFKGTAGKSSSGASMSKYDVEVETRLKALESQAHPDRCNDDTGGADSRVDAIIAAAKEAKGAQAGAEGKVEILLSLISEL